jgi:hypothetical protein
MSFSLKRRASVQLFATALHTFLLGIVLLASVPQVLDREGAYRPARESRLAGLDDFIEARLFTAARADNNLFEPVFRSAVEIRRVGCESSCASTRWGNGLAYSPLQSGFNRSAYATGDHFQGARTGPAISDC